MSDMLDSPYYALLRRALENSSAADEPALSFHPHSREIYLQLNGDAFEVDADAFLALVEQINPPWWPRYRQPSVERITSAADDTLPAAVPIEPLNAEGE